MKMKTGHIALTRLLPKTGQTVVYQSGDDGTYQAGWWRGKTVADNKVRFIAKNVSGDDIVIDRATGLTWAADLYEAGWNSGNPLNWVAAIAYIEGLTFAGYSDWRLPNIKELMSIIDFGRTDPALDVNYFLQIEGGTVWSATTSHISTTYAWGCDYTFGGVGCHDKIGELYCCCVRGGL